MTNGSFPPNQPFGAPMHQGGAGTEGTNTQGSFPFRPGGQNPQTAGAPTTVFGQQNSSPTAHSGQANGETLVATSAPVFLLFPSVFFGLISIGLNLYLTFSSISETSTSYLWVSLSAWAASAVVAIVALGVYFSRDAEKRSEGMYCVVGWKSVLYIATLVILAIGVVYSATHIGFWFGKQ